jgi:formylglycine-generating enzyme required for sulfatase activity
MLCLLLFACSSVVSDNTATNNQSAPAGMVRVEGGTFNMGSNSDEAYDDEKPTHKVTVSTFYMSKYEITQAEWVAVMGNNPSYFEGDNLPVEQVSWYDAIEYCNRRSVKEGLQPVYSGSGDDIVMNMQANGYRLPTEAEWEYAATGGNNTLHTYTYAGSNNVDEVGWYYDNSDSTTHPVGTKAPNQLGIYDMSGNVWEWVWDWYSSYTGNAQVDPTGAVSGAYRVERGGSWGATAQFLRSASRYYDYPSYRYADLGFRVVRL